MRLDRQTSDVDILPTQLPKISLGTDAVDLVIISQVLGDVIELEELFHEAARVLRPNGRMIVVETMQYPQHDLPHDYWRVMPQGLGHLARLTGFSIDRVTYLGGLFARFALLANTYVFGPAGRVPFIGPGLRNTFQLLTNSTCWMLDVIHPRPLLAPDYLAVLINRKAE